MQSCEIRDAPGKGQGLFATRDIRLGETIVRETSVCAFDASDVVQVAREFDFARLENFAGYDATLAPVPRLIKLASLNALPLGGDRGGLFTLASKMNHSCRPNANHHSSNAVVSVQALVDIKQGEEITTAYKDPMYWDRRRALLQSEFGFTCSCPACSVVDNRRDVTIKIANDLFDSIPQTLLYDRGRTEHSLRKFVELICSRLELRAKLPSALYDAFQFACANRDRGAADHYMALYLKYSLLFQGEGNEGSQKWREMEMDPTNHMIWGMASYAHAPVERLDVDAMLGL